MLSDPGRPSRISPYCRSFRIGFRFPKIVATCSCNIEADSLQEGASLLTAHRIPCVRFVWVVQRCVYPSQSRNTRYGWLAKPHPMVTCTPQEAPNLLGVPRNCFFKRVQSRLLKAHKVFAVQPYQRRPTGPFEEPISNPSSLVVADLRKWLTTFINLPRY